MPPRRRFLALLGAAQLFSPLAASAQSLDRPRRLALLLPLSPDSDAARRALAATQNRLRELGWFEGRNLLTEVRYALDDDPEGKVSRELLLTNPDVVLVGGAPVVALQRETRAVPIVFVLYGDPVGARLVTNLARPGGNLTGFTHYDAPLCGKWLEILKEIAPQIAHISALYVLSVFPATWWAAMENSARILGVRLNRAEIRDPASIEHSVTEAASEPNGGLIPLPSGVAAINQKLIAALAAQYRMPAIYPFRDGTEQGGLISYGVDRYEQFRLGAGYVDRILRGAKPGDLPIQQPTNFELVINLKTAKALGLAVPPLLLARADDVVE